MGASQSNELPKTFKRLMLTERNPDMSSVKIDIEETSMPTLAKGHVLVRVAAAPVNPSDYGDWTRGVDQKMEPVALGKEGSGVVVASGGGVYANSVVGKKVGFVSNVKGYGSYGQYCVVDAMQGIFPLPANVPVEAAASHFVNPYSAYGILDTARVRHLATKGAGPFSGLVHGAAASQLGQMLVKLCKAQKVTLINLVRKESQEELLRSLGAEHIINTSGEGWEAELQALIKKLRIYVAFDPIAGVMTGKVLNALPNKGSVFCYGGLSGQGCAGINPLDLIYKGKKLEGWLLPHWLKNGGSITMLNRLRGATASVNSGLVDGWSATQFLDCDQPEEMLSTLVKLMATGITGQKLRLRFPEDEKAAAAAAAVTAPGGPTVADENPEEEQPAGEEVAEQKEAEAMEKAEAEVAEQAEAEQEEAKEEAQEAEEEAAEEEVAAEPVSAQQ